MHIKSLVFKKICFNYSLINVLSSKHAQRLIHTPSTSGINVYNSLTKQKEPLKLKQEGNTLYWYTCGPTVYDSAHIGHAR